MENKINIVVYINELKKIHHAIREEKSKGVKDSNIKEIDVLKERCISDNIQSSLLSCQIFVRLIEDGILEASQVLAIFFSMLPYVKSNQYTGITEGIISILISDLRQRTILETTGDKYISPFEIRAPQHPIIMLLQKKYINMNDLVNKISGFCSHHDKNINKNSLEFLRPVFLYVLCNPNTIPDSKSLWTCLLTQSKKFPNAISLIDEIACWCKISSSTSILFTSILLTEAIEFMMTTENYQLAIEYTIYLTSLINDLIFWGYDPRPQFNLILRIFMELKEKHLLIGSIKECLNLILLLLSKPLQNMSPIYIDDFLPLLKWLITCTEEYNNQIIWFIILDSLIKLMANSYFLSNSAIDDLCKLIDLIEVHKSETPINTNKMITLISKIKYYHQDIAFYFDLLQLFEQFNKINLLIERKIDMFLNWLQNCHKDVSAKEFTNLLQLLLAMHKCHEKFKQKLKTQLQWDTVGERVQNLRQNVVLSSFNVYIQFCRVLGIKVLNKTFIRTNDKSNKNDKKSIDKNVNNIGIDVENENENKKKRKAETSQNKRQKKLKKEERLRVASEGLTNHQGFSFELTNSEEDTEVD